MKTIWKYNIPPTDYINLVMPTAAKILRFGLQNGAMTLWVLVNSLNDKTTRCFRLVGTGHEIKDDNLNYIGTVKMLNDSLIYHLFEIEL